jgi:uncharacterized tellurite resistance protein B-like protein
MGLFNFNKKKKFLSKLSSDQRDEITITLILMKQMIDADGVDKPEEKEYYKKYLINCGISSKEELESVLDRAGNLTSDQYDTIVHDFDEFQKLTILQELYGIICSDNEINQDELDLLFHISRDMGIDDDIIVDMLGAKRDLLEKFNESRSDSKSISNLDKFCSECGNQFESDQKFCPNCGNKRNIAELDEGELKDKVETDQENKQKIIEEAKAIIDKIKNNELDIRVSQGEDLHCDFQFNEEFKSYAETDEFKEHSTFYEKIEPFDYSYDNDIERYVTNPELYISLETLSGRLQLWQVFKVSKKDFLEQINYFIESVKEDCEYYGQYESVKDYLEEVEWDTEFGNLPYSEHTLGFNGPKLKECLIGFYKEENKGYELKIEFIDISNEQTKQNLNNIKEKIVSSNKKLRDEIPKNAKKINNEKDLIQELGKLDPEEYKKKAFDLWRYFFLKNYDESEEKDGWEIGQEVNSVMFDMYEVDFVSFFHNHKDSGDTETMGIRFLFKYLENGKPALIHNFPFKYDQINAHSSGSFYQLDDVWGSLNEVCKSLSELDVIDFNKLSQKEKIQLFRPNRDDYS